MAPRGTRAISGSFQHLRQQSLTQALITTQSLVSQSRLRNRFLAQLGAASCGPVGPGAGNRMGYQSSFLLVYSIVVTLVLIIFISLFSTCGTETDYVEGNEKKTIINKIDFLTLDKSENDVLGRKLAERSNRAHLGMVH